MLNDQSKSQQSGDFSVNLQAGNINIAHGLTVADAKEISLMVFKENFPVLAAQAMDTVKKNIEAFTEEYLTRLFESSPTSLQNFSDPGLMFTVYQAQRDFAVSGDKAIGNLLIDMLVERSKMKERDVLRIVTDESLKVIPKLTDTQIDMLTVIFLVKYVVPEMVHDLDSLKKYLLDFFLPFIGSVTRDPAEYRHIAYCGCGTVGIATMAVPDWSIEEMLLARFGGILTIGSLPSEMEKKFASKPHLAKYLKPCTKNPERLQTIFVSKTELEARLDNDSADIQDVYDMLWLYDRSLMETGQVTMFVQRLSNRFINFLNTWNHSDIKLTTLTSVGIAIAAANFQRKTKFTMDICDWI